MKQVIIRLRKHEADPLSVCSPEYITFCDEKSCQYLKHLLSDDRDYFKESELPIVKQLAEAHGWVMTLELEEKFKEDIERLKEREEFGGQMKFSELLEGKESFVPNDSLYLPNTHNDFKKELSNLRDQLDCAMGILEQFNLERAKEREQNAKLLEETIAYWKECERIALNAANEHSESVSKLHRRAQRAEGIIAKAGLVENRPQHAQGRSFGRALANYAAEQYRRERDEAIEFSNSRIQLIDNLYLQITGLLDDLEEYKKENAKLRDIAERIFAAGVGRMKTDDWRTLRAEFDQLKEGGK